MKTLTNETADCEGCKTSLITDLLIEGHNYIAGNHFSKITLLLAASAIEYTTPMSLRTNPLSKSHYEWLPLGHCMYRKIKSLP